MDNDTLAVDGSTYQAKHIRFMLKRADELSATNCKLREALVQAHLAMIGNREYLKGRALTHAGIDRCIEMADEALKS